MGPPVLDIHDLSIGFQTRAGLVQAVRGLNVTVARGEAMGLVGESGCGKSTVALGVMQDLGRNGRILGGGVRFLGEEMTEAAPERLRALRGNRIAMVYQEPMASLNPAMRVGRQLAEVPMLHRGATRAEAEDRAVEMLRAVRLPDPGRLMRAWPHQLSGGQQQRVVIAMALLGEPDLLLMDEPTTALDVTVEAGIIDLIGELARDRGLAMLFISHNLGLVAQTCGRMTVMYAGEAVETGPVAALFDDPRHPYTQGLLRAIPSPRADRASRPLAAIPGAPPALSPPPPGCAFAARCAHAQPGRCDVQAPALRSATGEGRMTACLRAKEIDWSAPPPRAEIHAPSAPGPETLRVEALVKRYTLPDGRSVKANSGVDLTAREGETIAIVGESGCGKSTLAKALLGLSPPTAGRIFLDNHEIGATPVRRREAGTLRALQMVFQNPFETLNPSRTVGAQLMRALERFGVGRDGADRRTRMLALLEMVKLGPEAADRLPRQLSGGQKQRIGVARAFAGEPRVVVADEPVSALDVSVQAAVIELLSEVQRRSRTTMLFISHDLAVVRYLSDRVAVMYLGHVVEEGTTEQVFGPPWHPYSEALLSAAPPAGPGAGADRIVLEGDPPSAIDPPAGCPFQTRCPRKAEADARCETELPPLSDRGDGHRIRCWLPTGTLARPTPRTGPA
jgi:peptide/nickel transport system ATP-binding protein